MDELKLDERENLEITYENSVFLFEQYISSHVNFLNRIEKENKENIIIRLNNFQIDSDRYLRFLLETQNDCKYTIIIYHVKNNVIPEGLYSSKNWPVFWIESITNSPLSELKTINIADCILFKDIYKDQMHDIYIHIFMQLYINIDSNFENHIDQEKVDRIFELIFTSLKEMKDSDGTPILNMINFIEIKNKLEDKTVNASYKYVDIKKEFFNTIVRQIPFLYNLILVLILNQDAINRRNIKDTCIFISNLFKLGNIEELFQIAELDTRNYQQLNHDNFYFFELILPQVCQIYEVYRKKRNDYPKIDKHIFKIFYDLQVKPAEDYLNCFCNIYFVNYLFNCEIYYENEFHGFSDKLNELIIGCDNKKKQNENQKKKIQCP